jgi:hypothetical protein
MTTESHVCWSPSDEGNGGGVVIGSGRHERVEGIKD